jgi:hypothetical protein
MAEETHPHGVTQGSFGSRAENPHFSGSMTLNIPPPAKPFSSQTSKSGAADAYIVSGPQPAPPGGCRDVTPNDAEGRVGSRAGQRERALRLRKSCGPMARPPCECSIKMSPGPSWDWSALACRCSSTKCRMWPHHVSFTVDT